ncbi:DUF3054 domain-containing protein [Jonesiaceae bacterium BS-20]|uniref:DUF3054 domain-containing protein n=1 Tax=Jonesiaceae bacterium BS-20 TaxID=3120821 RepID=A0AAU7DZ80_9MICO
MRKISLWALLDVAVVLVFASAGRSSHDATNNFAGILHTAWPFLIGLIVAWFITKQWKTTTAGSPVALQIWPAAIMMSLVTWAVGLAVRSFSGSTNAGGFPLVSLGFLVLILVGWRIIWGSIARIRAKNA